MFQETTDVFPNGRQEEGDIGALGLRLVFKLRISKTGNCLVCAGFARMGKVNAEQ